MKIYRKLFLFYCLLFYGSFAFSQSITVVDPHRGDAWCRTGTYRINWTKTGLMDEKVKIRLYDSSSTIKILNIVNSTDNDGSFSWTLPVSIAPGNYRVRVKTLVGEVYDDSDTFKITAREEETDLSLSDCVIKDRSGTPVRKLRKGEVGKVEFQVRVPADKPCFKFRVEAWTIHGHKLSPGLSLRGKTAHQKLFIYTPPGQKNGATFTLPSRK
jgi:hypothetical protein